MFSTKGGGRGRFEVDSLTSLELELEWALERPDTSRVYFTKCSWPEREKSGEGKK